MCCIDRLIPSGHLFTLRHFEPTKNTENPAIAGFLFKPGGSKGEHFSSKVFTCTSGVCQTSCRVNIS